MAQNNYHIVRRCIAYILVLAIALPIVAKFSHVFENHTHDICTGEIATHHVHSLEFECDFYKYKPTNSLTFQLQSFQLFESKKICKINISYYNEINEFQKLPFSLRGPPHLI